MFHWPVEYANGPVVTCASRLRPFPPRKSAANMEAVTVRSAVQSQYGSVTEESILWSSCSNWMRKRRCQGRKDGERWPTRSVSSPSLMMNSLCVRTNSSYLPLFFSASRALTKLRFSVAVRVAWFLRTAMGVYVLSVRGTGRVGPDGRQSAGVSGW